MHGRVSIVRAMLTRLLVLPLLLGSSLAAAADVLSWRNGGQGLYPDSTAPLDWDQPASLLF